jgi:hypothetical protein
MVKITGKNLSFEVWLCGTIRSFLLHVVLCGEACQKVDMPLHAIQYIKRKNVSCRITTLEDSNLNSDFNQDQKAPC